MLILSKLKYVIFDWDNTLAATRTALVAVVNQVLAEYQMPCWDIVKKRRDPNRSFRDNFPLIFGPELAEAAYERYRALYSQQIKDLIATFPGVQAVLEFFRSHKIPMLIMSNKDRRLLEQELPLLFDPAWFARIVCGHEAPKDKPYPEHIYYSLKGLLPPRRITPQNVWVVGDSPQDSLCAARAGARPIRIGRPIWDDPREEREDIIFYQDFLAFGEDLRRAEKERRAGV